MICEKCGTSYEGNFCPNGCNSPNFGKKSKKRFYQKWWFWLIAVFAVITVIGAAAGNESPEPPDPILSSDPAVSAEATTDQSAQPEQTAASGTEAETDTEAENSTEVPKNQDKVYLPGDVLDANGLHITYQSAEKWETYPEFFDPDEGYMYVRVYLNAENTAKSDRYVSAFEFNCYADGKKQEQVYFGDDTLKGGTISSGRSDEGYLCFQVPVDAKDIEIEYETNFWTDRKAIFKVVLS